MKFTDLSDHLHELREQRTKGALSRGRMMPVMDIWQGALDSPLTTVNDIRLKIGALPLGFEAGFVRFKHGDKDCVIIATGEGLSRARMSFVVAKELMHCWSPKSTYVANPESAGKLAQALCYTTTVDQDTLKLVHSDKAAFMAAAEVILPHYTLAKDFALGIPIEEIASRHSLSIEIAREICAPQTMNIRKSGSL